MGCCRGPRTGPEFDPEFEGPSEDDLRRFGSDAWCRGEDPMFDGDQPSGAARKPWVAVGTVVALAGFLGVIVIF